MLGEPRHSVDSRLMTVETLELALASAPEAFLPGVEAKDTL